MSDLLALAAKVARNATRMSQNRDQAIRDAHTAGHSIRAIAAATSLSPARIHQILHGR